MKNFVQDGNVVTVTAPSGGVVSGAGLIVGNIFGVCAFDADQTEEVEIAVVGVFELPKASGQINEGAAVSWDNSAHNVVAPGTGKFPIGVCVKLAGTSDPTCLVRLNGVSTVAA